MHVSLFLSPSQGVCVWLCTLENDEIVPTYYCDGRTDSSRYVYRKNKRKPWSFHDEVGRNAIEMWFMIMGRRENVLYRLRFLFRLCIDIIINIITRMSSMMTMMIMITTITASTTQWQWRRYLSSTHHTLLCIRTLTLINADDVVWKLRSFIKEL